MSRPQKAALVAGVIVLLLAVAIRNSGSSPHPGPSTAAAPALDPPQPAPYTPDQLLRDNQKTLLWQDAQWSSALAALEAIIADPACEQQETLLEAFHADAVAIRQRHRALLLHALARRDANDSFNQLGHISNPLATTETLVQFCKVLPRASTKYVMDSIQSFLDAVPARMNTYRQILAAYMKSSEQVRARFPLDLSRVPEIDERQSQLQQTVLNYVKQEDYLSAYVAAIHFSLLVDELREALLPYEANIYDKTHPRS